MGTAAWVIELVAACEIAAALLVLATWFAFSLLASPVRAQTFLPPDQAFQVEVQASGPRAIEVRFTYDINGVLQVESTTLGTGEKRELILQDNPGVLSEAELRERLNIFEDGTLQLDRPPADQQ